MPFLNAQFGYALSRAGKMAECDAMLAAVKQRATHDDRDALHAWRPVGVALVVAAVAQGRGDGATAAARMDPVIGRVTVVGGSDAQVDLFRQSYLGALSTAGRKADARTWLTAIRHPVATTPLDERWDEAVSG